jgi:hypothetical protein
MEPRTASPPVATVGDTLIYSSQISNGLFLVRKVTTGQLIGIVELKDGNMIDVHFDRATGAAMDGSGVIREANPGEIQELLDSLMP